MIPMVKEAEKKKKKKKKLQAAAVVVTRSSTSCYYLRNAADLDESRRHKLLFVRFAG